jgi:hypothetical protein
MSNFLTTLHLIEIGALNQNLCEVLGELLERAWLLECRTTNTQIYYEVTVKAVNLLLKQENEECYSCLRNFVSKHEHSMSATFASKIRAKIPVAPINRGL